VVGMETYGSKWEWLSVTYKSRDGRRSETLSRLIRRFVMCALQYINVKILVEVYDCRLHDGSKGCGPKPAFPPYEIAREAKAKKVLECGMS